MVVSSVPRSMGLEGREYSPQRPRMPGHPLAGGVFRGTGEGIAGLCKLRMLRLFGSGSRESTRIPWRSSVS